MFKSKLNTIIITFKSSQKFHKINLIEKNSFFVWFCGGFFICLSSRLTAVSIAIEKKKKKKQFKKKKKEASLGGLEPPTFRLTAERANQLRHRDN